MINTTSLKDNKELSQKELLKKVELIEKKLDKHRKDMDEMIKTLENKFMWELNLNGIEMLRGLK